MKKQCLLRKQNNSPWVISNITVDCLSIKLVLYYWIIQLWNLNLVVFERNHPASHRFFPGTNPINTCELVNKNYFSTSLNKMRQFIGSCHQACTPNHAWLIVVLSITCKFVNHLQVYGYLKDLLLVFKTTFSSAISSITDILFHHTCSSWWRWWSEPLRLRSWFLSQLKHTREKVHI